ncbi:hypothetical protein D3C80_1445990 [compost metagenome]
MLQDRDQLPDIAGPVGLQLHVAALAGASLALRHFGIYGQAVVQEDDAAGPHGLLGIDQVPQQKLEQVHPVQKGQIDAFREEGLQVTSLEEGVAGGLEEVQFGLCAHDVVAEHELGIDADARQVDLAQTLADVHADLEVGSRAAGGRETPQEVEVMNARMDVARKGAGHHHALAEVMEVSVIAHSTSWRTPSRNGTWADQPSPTRASATSATAWRISPAR